MDNKERKNISISGSGNVLGGYYDRVTISGAGRVDGDVDCKALSVSGVGKIDGHVLCDVMKGTGSAKIVGNLIAKEEIRLSGSGKISGRAETEIFKGSGSFSIEKGLKTKSFHVSGAGRINGCLSAEEVSISGSVNVTEDIEADHFKSTGLFDIGGLLNAEDIVIHLSGVGTAKCKEIGGEKIEVSRWDGGSFSALLSPFVQKMGFLEVDVIEGDKISLEYTKAERVCGDHVSIGPGCEIDYVEYTERLEVAEDAKVKESQQVTNRGVVLDK